MKYSRYSCYKRNMESGLSQSQTQKLADLIPFSTDIAEKFVVRMDMAKEAKQRAYY